MMELSSKQMILADYMNDCLKLFDIDSNTIINKKTPTFGPYNITKLPMSRLAVTLPDAEQIQVFTPETKT